LPVEIPEYIGWIVMTRNKKPRIITRCIADKYALPDEKIIEFSFPNGSGGLISFKMADHPIISLYRCDKDIEVRDNGKMDNEPA